MKDTDSGVHHDVISAARAFQCVSQASMIMNDVIRWPLGRHNSCGSDVRTL